MYHLRFFTVLFAVLASAVVIKAGVEFPHFLPVGQEPINSSEQREVRRGYAKRVYQFVQVIDSMIPANSPQTEEWLKTEQSRIFAMPASFSKDTQHKAFLESTAYKIQSAKMYLGFILQDSKDLSGEVQSYAHEMMKWYSLFTGLIKGRLAIENCYKALVKTGTLSAGDVWFTVRGIEDDPNPLDGDFLTLELLGSDVDFHILYRYFSCQYSDDVAARRRDKPLSEQNNRQNGAVR